MWLVWIQMCARGKLSRFQWLTLVKDVKYLHKCLHLCSIFMLCLYYKYIEIIFGYVVLKHIININMWLMWLLENLNDRCGRHFVPIGQWVLLWRNPGAQVLGWAPVRQAWVLEMGCALWVSLGAWALGSRSACDYLLCDFKLLWLSVPWFHIYKMWMILQIIVSSYRIVMGTKYDASNALNTVPSSEKGLDSKEMSVIVTHSLSKGFGASITC